MTIEQQVFSYKSLKENNQAFFIDNHEDAERIIEALEKQIPHKLPKPNKSYIPICGVCNGIIDLVQGDLNYCPNCGQKLYWSE